MNIQCFSEVMKPDKHEFYNFFITTLLLSRTFILCTYDIDIPTTTIFFEGFV